MSSDDVFLSSNNIPRESEVTLVQRRSRQRTNGWFSTFLRRLISVKPIEEAAHDGGFHGESAYNRSLSALDLTFIGIGGIIGAGIFVLTGHAARDNAGPALVISFLIAAFVCGLASVCYAELAALVPEAFFQDVYSTLGELVAWIIGWDLTLEYLVGAATVAVGWSGYFGMFIQTASNGRYSLDPRWSNAPVVWLEAGEKNREYSGFYRNEVLCSDDQLCNPYLNLPAIVISLILTGVLCLGVKSSSTVNNIFVGVKIVVILIFIFGGIKFIDTSNYSPFIPPNTGAWGKYGWSGIFQAATTVFFAFIGFDAVSTTALEARRPQRDLPIGIISSLGICTVLYIAVTLILTGVKKYTEIDVKSPVASALPIAGLAIVIEIGAVAGLTSVLLILLMAQPRILQAMAGDGLLPEIIARVDSRTKVPIWATVITGALCAVFAGVLPIDILGNMTSVGTLFAFALVCAAVPILRYTKPSLDRKFKVPGGPIVGGYVIPILGAISSIGLIGMIYPQATKITVVEAVGTPSSIARLFIWMAIGLIIYFSFGYRNSRIGRRDDGDVEIAFERLSSKKLEDDKPKN
ncbi:hypothetical protein HDU97_004113 [Phlyctochytrium planicorne]|nr:hypothetical protein HDU97_004113 [Phlyctochytrium planicorne]